MKRCRIAIASGSTWMALWCAFCFCLYLISNGIGVAFWNVRDPRSRPMQTFLDVSSAAAAAATTPNLRDEMLFRNVSRDVNFPIDYWLKIGPRTRSRKCARLPNPYEVLYSNVHWQKLTTSGGTFYLYSAYHDDRSAFRVRQVRIIAMIDRVNPPMAICQLWFDMTRNVRFAKASYTYGWNPNWGSHRSGILQPFVISCPLSGPGWIPEAVSLVETKCQNAKNLLKVVKKDGRDAKRRRKSRIAVCVKGLDFPSGGMVTRLIEWLELIRILGADKVFVYDLNVHPDTYKVLKYYEEIGFVDVKPLTLPGDQPNHPQIRHVYLQKRVASKRLNELVPYNDCLYRNIIDEYRYVVLLDVDEVIVPLLDHDWIRLVSRMERSTKSARSTATVNSFNARNLYFLDSFGTYETEERIASGVVPSDMHMLQHIYRSVNHSRPKRHVKCFHLTDRIISIHNHFPRNCLSKECTSYEIGTDIARLHHYRATCPGTQDDTSSSCSSHHKIRDVTLWKYKEELVEKTKEALTTIERFD
ncbi:Uncharacterised protein g9923 [Pycnogonum litorale]